MTTYLKQATFATLLCAAAASHAQATSDVRKVAPFHAIELSGPYKVVITGQGTQALELSGQRKELERIETIVQGDTLIVRPRSRGGIHISFGADERTTITIAAPGLRSLANAGSADVSLSQVDAEQFALKLSGSGDVEAYQLKTGKLQLTMKGSGDVKLAGAARTLQVDAHGSGDLDACDLAVERSSAVLRGSGEACVPGGGGQFSGEVHGSGELTVRQLRADKARLVVTGSGEIGIDGTVGSLSADLNGSGSVEGENLVAQQATVTVRGSGSAEVRVKPTATATAQLMHYDRKGASTSRD
ncbi:DUF2807 domain-containing protein [Massilia sp. P8910]|uniref:head GIN domain-containing protein n=1 Tax=Massilia antarctica TaxID=2765360 RepID=UPI0006BB6941|nr:MULTISPECIES: head GIN domain-containing protein [Massilia]MCE3602214.1 DUF2807 domain-containing protein [Massilia antarctica]MCY0914881.1 DUF2807 domain-containing protein [Massilia sp. H27-R4]CUI08072.1 hypothetical protein BN2497_10921 [Janthinobacterium sp. CG23_2]CUU31858.1 hypothetical protein BN3177_10921 [Janthinobacterium sp. CG23_2]